MVAVTIPSFYLYGEPHRAVEDGFVHAERLDDRSRPHEWTILPHAHADLVQLFLLERGGGVMRAEADSFPVTAPALLIVPAGIVHGFDWYHESEGAVVTLSVRHLALLDSRYPGLAAVFDRAGVVYPDEAAIATIGGGIATLMRELGWSAPGHGAAVDAALLTVLVETLRASGVMQGGARSAPGHHHSLVARFRARIDERFRLREPIAVYAEALGTSESRLRVACARIAALSPAAMLDQRAMLDAKRALLYTNLSVAEVGYSIGFSDPAYFTRFFTRHAGVSPRAYRQMDNA
ncbi:bacterial regulatory helix-turn-helix s, AraC family protein [Sphingomonas sp. S17]|uniref:Helix-turn-helix domain-containing protein n=2 Tax=Sphingomonas paucimobilis TaxID=13689 RepID=A0A7T3A780_SPHPI|nr:MULTISPECIES: helix-turn-helix domain-containing protein [Sphingomonas]EGI55428.1 bacterial regulatory helix-turn-helix s, AraC family protein [Sphingomonas sp. S17]MCM3680928.1 helix-turn-helix domain-containing protein [Sphingomonas paucimobilis]MDG5971360.1 helix-turn-helix domain-containing protein [Sphingomonas paucimobilis]QPS15934.1 helix-turn-helix domain-containing protein [Sphingomonas paucimobilis]QPT07388.1 helix-turn-helix domain-containing protein [Sphingomonas paucimobilis]